MSDPLQFLLKEANKRDMYPHLVKDYSKDIKNSYEWSINHASGEQGLLSAFADVLSVNPPPIRPMDDLFISIYANIPDPSARQGLDTILADKKLTPSQKKEAFPFSSVNQWDVGVHVPSYTVFGNDEDTQNGLEYFVRFKQTPQGIIVAGIYYLHDAEHLESMQTLHQKTDDVFAESIDGSDKLSGEEFLMPIKRGREYRQVMPMLITYFDMLRREMNEGEFDREWPETPEGIKKIAEGIKLKRTPPSEKN